jgi:SAM-dependent methyltransferase
MANILKRLGPRAILLKTTIIGTRSPHSEPNKKIKKLQSEYNRILDVGCGNGKNFIFPLTVGIDADVRILRTAKEKGICLCGDGQNLPFRDGILDLSLFCYSLEYMKDPDKAREEGLRVSRENYELVYPGYYSWENVQRRMKG